MKISLLTIGDELIFGEIVDGNAARIGRRLHGAGLKAVRCLTVGDHEQDIVDAILFLAECSDAVIITGGLGPTSDDMTARAAARATGRRLMLNEEALASLKAFCAGLEGDIHPLNDKQALLPAKAEVIPNPIGTACGFRLLHNGKHLIFMPGVPEEMGLMLDTQVMPFLLERFRPSSREMVWVFKVFGLSEPQVEELVTAAVGGPVPGLALAYCVDFPEIQVKLRFSGEICDLDDAGREEILDRVRRSLGAALVTEGDQSIDQVVAALFRTKGKTLALAESCTGGLIAKRITDLPGSSAYFREGLVTYADEAKIRYLDLPRELLQSKGAVSMETARAMAWGARRRSGCDLALAVTGIAGPDGGTEAKPVGTVFIAIADQGGCVAKGFRFTGDREKIRTMTAYTAMDWLRRRLMSY